MYKYDILLEPSKSHPYSGSICDLEFDNQLSIGDDFEFQHTSATYRNTTLFHVEVISITGVKVMCRVIGTRIIQTF